MSKPKGYVLYDGASMINGKPIVAILTLKSSNVKTGNMAQIWIMAKDTAPHTAQKNGDNESVCGDCPIKNQCYVLTFQGPLSVWNAYQRGVYPMIDWDAQDNLLSELIIRFGAYGDPAALPEHRIDTIADRCKDFTGYTHQWIKPKFNFLKHYFMASVETLSLKIAAQSLGFRTFRIKAADMPINDSEIVCPADSKGLTCLECKLCNGSKHAADIVIDAHGARAGGIAYA